LTACGNKFYDFTQTQLINYGAIAKPNNGTDFTCELLRGDILHEIHG